MLFPTGYIYHLSFIHQKIFSHVMFNIYIVNSNICIAMLLISEYDILKCILSGFLPFLPHFRIFPCILKEKYPKISINYTYVPWKTKYCTWAANIFCNSNEEKLFLFQIWFRKLSIHMLRICVILLTIICQKWGGRASQAFTNHLI